MRVWRLSAQELRERCLGSELALATCMPPQLAAPIPPAASRVLALVIVWSAREPHRVGEVALCSCEGQLWILGRQPQSHAHGMNLRMQGIPVSFARQRPAGALDRGSANVSASMLAGEGISRRQLEILVQKETLLVKNIGRCPLRVNGVAVTQALVRARDTLQLGKQLILYCCWRPLVMPSLQAYPPERAARFGEPDQDGLIGESPAIWALRERLAQAASTHEPVGVKGACRVTRDQAERALTALRSAVAANLAAGSRCSLGVARTEPGFQEVEVPELNEHPEDIPFILNHFLREQAQEDQDLSLHFWMGLPRVHPSLIETLLHQHYTHHLAEMAELVLHALRRPASVDGKPEPPPRGSRRKSARRSKAALPPPQPPTAESLRASTRAMLFREGLSIPIEWAQRGRPRPRGAS